jgi:hypothetical protein
MHTRELFQQHLEQHCQKTGFTAPELLLDYLADLLASRLTRVDLIPDPSFGERYLQLYQESNPHSFKDYADSALFFCSLMPDYGRRRGLSMDYYATLGISTYYTVADIVEDSRYTQLGNWFYHLQRFLNTAIKPEQRLELFNFPAA